MCVQDCSASECQIGNVCQALTTNSQRRTSSSNDACLSLCATGTCRPSGSFVCETITGRRTSSLNDVCKTECDANECHFSNVCNPTSDTNVNSLVLRTGTKATDSACISECGDTSCYNSDKACITPVDGSVRRTDSQACFAACNTTECRLTGTFVCRTVNTGLDNAKKELVTL